MNAGRLKPLKPEALVIRRLRERFPDAIHHTFGIDPGTLSATEASHLRLRAKGFQLEAQPAPLNQEGEP